uniref:Uncharacterized protein n=1 Tax=Tetraselmis chuii TaxID=63592 RepID=A0A7S1SKV8_9CHLO
MMADGSVSVTYDGTPRIRNAASIVGLSKGGSSVSLDMSEAGECAALTTPAPPSPTTTTTTPAAPPPTTTTTTAPPVTSTTPSPAPSTDLLCLEVNGDINVEWIDAGERATCVAANGDQIGSAVDCSGSFLVERMSSPQAALLAVCVL